jgi:hypothetical protein
MPAPTMWDGNISMLEQSVQKFEGHIKQQPMMSFLIHSDFMKYFMKAWMKHGLQALTIMEKQYPSFCHIVEKNN